MRTTAATSPVTPTTTSRSHLRRFELPTDAEVMTETPCRSGTARRVYGARLTFVGTHREHDGIDAQEI
jgi:hypothetical protein